MFTQQGLCRDGAVVLKPVDLGLNPRIHISNKFPGDA